MKNKKIIGLLTMFFTAMPPLLGSAPAQVKLSDIFPKDVLAIMSPMAKDAYTRQINNAVQRGEDLGFIKHSMQDLVASWNKKLAEMQKSATSAASSSSSSAPKPNNKQYQVIFLEKYTQGGMCTYNMLFDGDIMYTKLMHKGSVDAKDLSSQICPSHQALTKLQNENIAEYVQPSNERIIQLIEDMDLMKHKNYAMIDNVLDIPALVGEQKTGKELVRAINDLGDFALHLDEKQITAFKTNPKPAAFIFLLNKGGHWFVVVAHKKNNQLTFYVSDRDQKKLADYHEAAIKLLAKLLQG